MSLIAASSSAPFGQSAQGNQRRKVQRCALAQPLMEGSEPVANAFGIEPGLNRHQPTLGVLASKTAAVVAQNYFVRVGDPRQ